MSTRNRFAHYAAICCATALLVAGSAPGISQDSANYPLPWPKPSAPDDDFFSNPPLPIEKPVLENTQTPEAPSEDDGLAEAETEPKEENVTNFTTEDEAETTAEPEEVAPEEPAEPPVEWTVAELAVARQQCRDTLRGLHITYIETDPIGFSNGCGVAAPIEVTYVGTDHVIEISPEATINCNMAAALLTWVDETLQPAALEQFDSPVSRIQNASSYACRRRNNAPTGKLSEHALGNALDVSGFIWDNGDRVTVEDGWPSLIGDLLPGPEARFLKAVHKGGCEVFSTVLGPEANALHADHFHFDLGRGGNYLICD